MSDANPTNRLGGREVVRADVQGVFFIYPHPSQGIYLHVLDKV